MTILRWYVRRQWLMGTLCSRTISTLTTPKFIEEKSHFSFGQMDEIKIKIAKCDMKIWKPDRKATDTRTKLIVIIVDVIFFKETWLLRLAHLECQAFLRRDGVCKYFLVVITRWSHYLQNNKMAQWFLHLGRKNTVVITRWSYI